jgi:transposase
MTKNIELIGKVIQMVIDGKLSHRDAADLLETSVRTIHNYVKRYLEQGQEGLVDHRRSNNHKLNPEIERRIVECKAQRPQRSAHWIRNWLKLSVSDEAVRRVLAKHHFTNGRIHVSKSGRNQTEKRIGAKERKGHKEKISELSVLGVPLRLLRTA